MKTVIDLLSIHRYSGTEILTNEHTGATDTAEGWAQTIVELIKYGSPDPEKYSEAEWEGRCLTDFSCLIPKEEPKEGLMSLAIAPTPAQLIKIQKNMSKIGFKVVSGLLHNYPEASSGWIRCTKYGYNYNEAGVLDKDNPAEDYWMEFAVGPQGDYVNSKTPIVRVKVSDVVRVGFARMFLDVLAGGCKGYFRDGLISFLDADYWDSDSIDGLMQFHFYGEVLCG